MPSTAQSTQFDTLTPIQVQVLNSLVTGRSISAAAREAGVHRTTVHLWTRTLPDFARGSRGTPGSRVNWTAPHE